MTPTQTAAVLRWDLQDIVMVDPNYKARTPKPGGPNRATRRADAKRKRKLRAVSADD